MTSHSVDRLSSLSNHFISSQELSKSMTLVSDQKVGDSSKSYPEVVDHNPKRGVRVVANPRRSDWTT